MTEKELRKLGRHDLLELLVEQSREAARLDAALQEKEEEFRKASEGNERLKEKLNEKDELIEKLKGRLDQKDAEMAQRAAGIEETMEAKIEALEAEAARLRSEGWKELQESNLPAELLTRLKALM